MAHGFEKTEHHGHELSTPITAGTAGDFAMNHHGGVDPVAPKEPLRERRHCCLG